MNAGSDLLPAGKQFFTKIPENREVRNVSSILEPLKQA